MKLNLFFVYLASFAIVRGLFGNAAAAYFAPSLALTLYIGQTGSGVFRAIIPIVLIAATDFIFGFGHPTMWVGYAIIGIATYFAPQTRTSRSQTHNHRALFLYGVGTITLFDLATNFTLWYGSSYWPQTQAGLASCFIAAYPFYLAKLLGLTAVAVGHRLLTRIPAMQREAHFAI